MSTVADDGRRPVRRALVSVYDKTGLEDLAPGCTTPGSRSCRPGRRRPGSPPPGCPVTPVEEVTGFPECLDGRVKTLHPAVHAGLLADRRLAEPPRAARRAGHRAVRPGRGQPLPVPATVASGATPDECVEQIDIGGPAMVRAAAKNHPSVAVVVDPARYADVLGRRRRGRLHPRRSAGGWRRRRSRTPRPTTSRWRPGSPPSWRPSRTAGRLPRRRGCTRDGACCATARTRTSGPRSTATRPARRAGRRRAAARQGDELQQLRRHRRGLRAAHDFTRALRRDHQAHQPVRHRRRGADARPSPTRTARRTPATRCRRSAASSRPTGR